LRLIALAFLFISSTAVANRAAVDVLPDVAGSEHVYIKMQRSIAFIESRGDPSAKNRVTSASGKYQFMASWNRWFKANAGITWASVVPLKKAPKSVKAKMSDKQDRLFNTYYNKIVSPWLKYIRRKNMGEMYSDPELVALAHRQGTIGAERYLKTGIDPYNGKFGNRHVTAHIRAMRKAMGFEQYLDTQMLMPRRA